MIYALKGGGVYRADSCEKFVRKLNEMSLLGSHNHIKEYMEEVSEKCKVKNNLIIRTDSYEHFIDDLTRDGFLVAIDENEIFPIEQKFRP